MSATRVTHHRVFLSVGVSWLCLAIAVMCGRNDLDHTRLLEDPTDEVIGKSGIASLKPNIYEF
jgi:hypothetical protein